jgi:hypothetical protein
MLCCHFREWWPVNEKFTKKSFTEYIAGTTYNHGIGKSVHGCNLGPMMHAVGCFQLTPIFQQPMVSLPVRQGSLTVSILIVKANYVRNTPQGEKPHAKSKAQSLFFMDGDYRHFVGSRHLGVTHSRPPGRYPVVGQARSMLCFLAVRELELTATELAGQMGWMQPAIKMSVKRGAGIVKEKPLNMDDFID